MTRDRSRGGDLAQRVITVYIAVFFLLSVAGWFPEIAGRLGASWISADYAALFHASDTFQQSSSFEDLTDFSTSMRHPTGTALAGQRGPFPYLPAAAYVFSFFLRLFPNPVAAYFVAFGLTLVFFSVVLWSRLGASGRRGARLAIILTMLIGSPQIYTADRANLEWVSWALTAGSVVCLIERRYVATAILIGLAAAIKPFPVIFFVPLLWRRQYRAVGLGCIVIAVVSVVALYALGPTVGTAAHAVANGWADYFNRYVLVVRTAQEFRFDHSLLDAVKVPIWFLLDHQQYDPRRLDGAIASIPTWARLDVWARGLEVFSVLALASVGWRFRKAPLLNGIFALVICEALLPYSAAEYTNLLLYIPWSMLLLLITRFPELGQKEMSASEIQKVLIPCALLFTPLSFMSCFTGFSKTSLLIYLMVQVSRTPLPCVAFDTA